MLTMTNTNHLHPHNFESDYLLLLRHLVMQGKCVLNARTGHDTFKLDGQCSITMDVRDGRMPVLTTKKFYWKPMVGELLGFLRGYNNAAMFRSLGCNIWNENANNNRQWLANPNREGTDDLGRIYGVQWRRWNSSYNHEKVDQLRNVLTKLAAGQDDRRLIVSAWKPDELAWMALPPCHIMWQVFINGPYLDLVWYQRSCDVFLGLPFNCASYALLLNILCMVNPALQPRFVTGHFGDTHLYDNQIDAAETQLSRVPEDHPPTLDMLTGYTLPSDTDPVGRTQDFLHWLERQATPDMFQLNNYTPQPAISVPMVV